MIAAQYNALTASTLIVSGRGRLLGYSAQETAGTPALASVPLYDGTSTGGTLFHRIGLAASGNVSPWFGPYGIKFDNGLFIGAFTGTLVGTVYYWTETALGSEAIIVNNGTDERIIPKFDIAQLTALFNGAH